MSKSFYTVVILILSVFKLQAQIPAFSSWSNTYISVYSYDGASQTGGITLRITQSGPLNISNWKMSVKAIPSTISNGHYFPPEKMSLHPSSISGQAQDPGPLPTISTIGILNNTILANNSDVYFIPLSNAPLYNKGTYNSYYDLQMIFDLNILGGSYLTDLKAGSPQYPVSLLFTLYGANNEVLRTTVVNYTIQVHASLSGTPPVENKYSIKVSSGARNGLLNVSSLSDYVNGASVTYTNGLSIASNTDYQVSVKSMSSTFSSIQGNTLPLGIVNVALLPTSGNQAYVTAKPLSNASQILSTGNTTNNQAVYYDIKYYTSPNDQRLVQAKMDEYTITLQYEITPR